MSWNGLQQQAGVSKDMQVSPWEFFSGARLLLGKDYGPEQKALYDEAIKSVGGAHGASQAALYHALSAIHRGYSGAQGALNMQGGLATKEILDREKQSLGSSQQSMISRGLYDTSAQDNAQRGITSDTNNALASLNAQLAQLGSNIKISEAQDTAGVYGQLASSDTQYAALLAQLGLGKAGGVEQGRQGGFAGLAAGIIGSISDRRLKKDIELIGVADGMSIYEFAYKDEIGMPGRYRGVMADEVATLRPDAVTVGEDGYMRVDYGKLGFELRRVS